MTTLDSPFPNQESSKKIMKIQNEGDAFFYQTIVLVTEKGQEVSHPVDYKSF